MFQAKFDSGDKEAELVAGIVSRTQTGGGKDCFANFLWHQFDFKFQISDFK